MTASRSSTIYVAVALVQRGLNILILPLVTRAMGPSEYGQAAILVAATAVMSVVFGSALENAVFRWGARSDAQANSVIWLSRIYILVVVPGVAAVAALVFVGFDVSPFGIDGKLWALEIVAVACMASMSFYALPLLRSQERLRPFVLISGVSISSIVLAKVLFVVIADDGVQGWVHSDVTASAVSYLAALGFTAAGGRRSAVSSLGTLLRYSVPLVPHRLSFWALSSLDRPLFATVATFSQVGLYSLAASLSAVGVMLISEVNRGVLLEYSRARFPLEGGHLAKVIKVQVLVLLAAPTVIAAGLDVAHPLIVDDAFEGTLTVVAALIVSQVAYGLYLLPTNIVIQTHGATTLSWLSSASGALVAFGGIILMGPNLGAHGVAYGVVAGHAVMCLVAFMVSRRLRLQIAWSTFRPPAFSLILATTGLALASAGLLLGDRQVQIGCGLAGLIVTSAAWAHSRGRLDSA